MDLPSLNWHNCDNTCNGVPSLQRKEIPKSFSEDDKVYLKLKRKELEDKVCLSPGKIKEIARHLQKSEKQVKFWFYND